MAPGDPDADKEEVLRFRCHSEPKEYVESMAEAHDMSNSEVLRTIVRTHGGILLGNFWALVDPDDLREEWGPAGQMMASMIEDDDPVPEGDGGSRLADVLRDQEYIMAAVDVETGRLPVNGEGPDE